MPTDSLPVKRLRLRGDWTDTGKFNSTNVYNKSGIPHGIFSRDNNSKFGEKPLEHHPFIQ